MVESRSTDGNRAGRPTLTLTLSSISPFFPWVVWVVEGLRIDLYQVLYPLKVTTPRRERAAWKTGPRLSKTPTIASLTLLHPQPLLNLPPIHLQIPQPQTPLHKVVIPPQHLNRLPQPGMTRSAGPRKNLIDQVAANLNIIRNAGVGEEVRLVAYAALVGPEAAIAELVPGAPDAWVVGVFGGVEADLEAVGGWVRLAAAACACMYVWAVRSDVSK